MSETKKLTNALLKEKMTDAMVDRNVYLPDFNNVDMAAGVYRVHPEVTKNIPEGIYGYGIATLEKCFLGNDLYMIQRYYSNKGECLFRDCWKSAWGLWRIVAAETI